MIARYAMEQERFNMSRPIPEIERDPQTLQTRWQQLKQHVLNMAEDTRYHPKQSPSGLILMQGDQAYGITFFMGIRTPEILSTVTSTSQILACLWHDQPCQRCGCRLYYALNEHTACVRCLPPRGYHRYADLIDRLYPKGHRN
jgi:hypothetical protein